MGNSVRFQMSIETVSKIVRNFPQVACKKFESLSEIEIKMIMMVDCPLHTSNNIF